MVKSKRRYQRKKTAAAPSINIVKMIAQAFPKSSKRGSAKYRKRRARIIRPVSVKSEKKRNVFLLSLISVSTISPFQSTHSSPNTRFLLYGLSFGLLVSGIVLID